MSGRAGLVRYAAGWLAAVAALVTVALVLRADDTTVPWLEPVEAAPAARTGDLDAAARAAGCRVRRVTRRSTDDLIRQPTEPPTFGPPVPRAAAPGVYADDLDVSDVVGALRRGHVVVRFRRTLPDEQLRLLRAVHDERPGRSLLVPDARGMPYAVAATAWRRLLACPRVDRAGDVADALRAFRARYEGKGPER